MKKTKILSLCIMALMLVGTSFNVKAEGENTTEQPETDSLTVSEQDEEGEGEDESTQELIDIPVEIQFEEVGHETYAEQPETVSLTMSYQNESLGWEYKNIEVSRENDYKTIIKDLPKEVPSGLWQIRYDFIINYDEDIRKYYTGPVIIRVNDGHADPIITEALFELTLKKTDIYLDLNIGELESSYSRWCDWGVAPDPNPIEPDDVPGARGYITKSDNDIEDNLSNATFKLVDQSGKLVQEQKTDENGKLAFENVPYGKYKIIQENAPAQLEINENELEVDIDLHDDAAFCNYNVKWYNPEKPEDPVDPEDPKPEDPVDPTDPVDPVDPTDPVDPVNPTSPETLPQTGVSNQIPLYGLLMLLSGSLLVLLNKKKQLNKK